MVRPVQEPGLQGQIIGSYTLDSLLGQGGMGAVWLAHRSDGRYEAHVAVKLLNPALLGPGGIERFRREGRALVGVYQRSGLVGFSPGPRRRA